MKMKVPIKQEVEVRRCPFCTSNKLQIHQGFATLYPWYTIQCKNCNAEGPTASDEEGAVKKWNSQYD